MKKPVELELNKQFYISDRNSLWDFPKSLTPAQLLLQVWTQAVVCYRAASRGRADFPGSPDATRSLLVGRWSGNTACPSHGPASSLVGMQGSLAAQATTGWKLGAHFGLKTLLHPCSSDVVVFSISDIVTLELYKNIILWVYNVWVCIIDWIYKSFYFKSLVPFLGQIYL